MLTAHGRRLDDDVAAGVPSDDDPIPGQTDAFAGARPGVQFEKRHGDDEGAGGTRAARVAYG